MIFNRPPDLNGHAKKTASKCADPLRLFFMNPRSLPRIFTVLSKTPELQSYLQSFSILSFSAAGTFGS